MSSTELETKIRDLMELKRMQEELAAEVEAAQDEIKGIMGDSEVLVAGPYKVTWKAVTSSRVDTTALKKELPEVAARFLKTSTVRRFLIA